MNFSRVTDVERTSTIIDSADRGPKLGIVETVFTFSDTQQDAYHCERLEGLGFARRMRI